MCRLCCGMRLGPRGQERAFDRARRRCRLEEHDGRAHLHALAQTGVPGLRRRGSARAQDHEGEDIARYREREHDGGVRFTRVGTTREQLVFRAARTVRSLARFQGGRGGSGVHLRNHRRGSCVGGRPYRGCPRGGGRDNRRGDHPRRRRQLASDRSLRPSRAHTSLR